MKLLANLVERTANDKALDKIAAPIAQLVHKATAPRLVRNLLSGTPLGHPAHPMLTDIPIGAWGAATLLDLVGGKRAEPGADFLVNAGTVAALPTIASGLNDFGDTYGEETRIALTHGIANGTGMMLFIGSSLARSAGRRRLGK